MPLKPVGLLGSEPQVCILHEILHAVQYQRVGDDVLFGVFRHIALEKTEVEDMNFRIVLHGELGKGVAVGVFNKQELAALSAALNDGLCLVGVQKHRILVAAGQVFPLVNTFCFILAIVIGNMAGLIRNREKELLNSVK